MNRTTLIWMIAAAGSLAGAFVMRPVEIVPEPYLDTDEPLFPNFTNPTAATSLEVQGWNEQEAQIVAFKVEMQDGKWVIPSHHNYPADGVERMGRAAASLIGVRKDIVRDDDVRSHGAYGVKTPDDADATEGERGQRIILKDASGTTLADVIVGHPVDGKEGYHYVRLPDSNRVYASKVKLDVSTNFEDWIEKDLLHVERDEITEIESNAYRVDEATRRIEDSVPLVFLRGDGENNDDWTLSEKTPAPKGKTLKASAVRTLLGAVDRLNIVGVRPQPEQLDALRLATMGFFVTPGGQLVGNEGQVAVITEDGIVYTLFFGEVTSLSGRALTAGVGAEEEKQDEKAEGDNRFMFVNVSYDPASDRTLKDKKAAPSEGKADDATGADKKAAEGASKGEANAEPSEADTLENAEAENLAAGQKRAAELAQRFDRWFYVISNASFKQIHKSPTDFFEDVKAD